MSGECGLFGMVEKKVDIRGKQYVVVDVSKGKNVLLREYRDGKPFQYIVGTGADVLEDGTLTWEEGYYFPFESYQGENPSRQAFAHAVFLFVQSVAHVVLTDSSCGIHVLGIYSDLTSAKKKIEKEVNDDEQIKSYAKERGVGHVTYDMYMKDMFTEAISDHEYWIESQFIDYDCDRQYSHLVNGYYVRMKEEEQ